MLYTVVAVSVCHLRRFTHKQLVSYKCSQAYVRNRVIASRAVVRPSCPAGTTVSHELCRVRRDHKHSDWARRVSCSDGNKRAAEETDYGSPLFQMQITTLATRSN